MAISNSDPRTAGSFGATSPTLRSSGDGLECVEPPRSGMRAGKSEIGALQPMAAGSPGGADLARTSGAGKACSCPEAVGSHCGRILWAIPLLQAGRSRPRHESGVTGIGKLENGSRPKAISEIARLRRSLPEPDPENRAAIKHQECSTTDNHGYRRLAVFRSDVPHRDQPMARTAQRGRKDAPSGPHSPGREEGGQFAGARETTGGGRRIAFRTYLCPCSGGE